MAIVKEHVGIDTGVLTARELVSDAPEFNFERARQAASLLQSRGLPEFPALNLALALRIYNQDETGVEEAFQPTKRRLSQMIAGEITASDLTDPRPTIGFEVESPKKSFDKERDSSNYSYFFDAIGMPRNKANAGTNAAIFWEFSPPPAYSAAVQRRILHELIQGRFIPTLLYSQDPVDIRTYLDDKLVSLHINLGIPNLIQRGLVNFKNELDVLLFSSMFAYAFTSPLRLQQRNQTIFTDVKEAEQTAKSGGQYRRLELKAFEVGNETTYRLMEEVQLMGTALFADVGDYREDLALIWREVSNQAKLIYEIYKVDVTLLKDNRTEAAQKVGNPEFVRTLRHLITTSALNIRSLINQP